MTQSTSPPKKPAQEAAPAAEDFSKAIEQSVERQPDEQVKSVHLFGDYYRCNWWVPDKTSHPFWIITGRIRKSRFLRVTRPASELLIEDASSRA